MKKQILSTLLASSLGAQAQLQSDQHWFYEHPQLGVEPFAFLSTADHLYAGGLFLNTEGLGSNGKNFVRYSFETNTWQQVPGLTNGLDGRVDTIVDGDDGFIYVGGNFGTPAGTAAKRIARFNPTTGEWQSLFDATSALTAPNWDNGPSDGRVLAIVRSGDFIYVGGNFTLASIPTNERYILRYNTVTNVWGPVGSGTGVQVDALEVLPNGDVIAATRNTAGLMRWDGSTWSTYANGITGPGDSGDVDPEDATGAVRHIKRHPDGRIFVAGSFNAAGGISASFVAAYNPSNNTWDNLDGGFGLQYIQSNGTTFTADGVYDMKIAPDGKVYVGGDFQSSADGSNNSLNHIAVWDESGEWQTLGSGLGSTGSQIVSCLAFGPEGELYAGGTFSRGWRQSKSASTQFAEWDLTQVLTPVPVSEDQPIITTEDGILYMNIRTVPGNQYKIQESSSLPFPPLADQFGRFGSSNWNLLKRELGPAPTSGNKFYRVIVF